MCPEPPLLPGPRASWGNWGGWGARSGLSPQVGSCVTGTRVGVRGPCCGLSEGGWMFGGQATHSLAPGTLGGSPRLSWLSLGGEMGTGDSMVCPSRLVVHTCLNLCARRVATLWFPQHNTHHACSLGAAQGSRQAAGRACVWSPLRAREAQPSLAARPGPAERAGRSSLGCVLGKGPREAAEPEPR